MKQILNNLRWIEELLPDDMESAPKNGGMAYYYNLKLVLILIEKPGTYVHKGATYPFDIWNGCILPVEYKKQNAFFLKFSFLENHPANKDWLYIPAESDDFEDEVKQFIKEIVKGNPLLGTAVKFTGMPKEKPADLGAKKSSAKTPKVSKKRENELLLGMLGQKK